jgi:peptidoglycan-associated lipoprotein
MKKIFSVLMILGVMIVGCAHRDVVKTADLPKKEAPAVENRQPKGKQIERQPLKDISKSKDISERELSKKQISDRQETIRVLETKFHDIYFNYDNYSIRDNAQALLEQLSSALLKNQKIKVLIEGNCDERGTAEYNIALGDRRANAAKQYLSALGIPSSRMDTISYGKEKPICTENNEKCWVKNRRDHFVFK